MGGGVYVEWDEEERGWVLLMLIVTRMWCWFDVRIPTHVHMDRVACLSVLFLWPSRYFLMRIGLVLILIDYINTPVRRIHSDFTAAAGGRF
jgi:hypothetical protein